MRNDVIELNTIVGEIGSKIAELAQLGRNSYNVPLVTTGNELSEMVGLPMGPWNPLSNDLIWFQALKTTIFAREMLEQCARIFTQIEDEKSTQKVQAVIDTVDEQFHPAETAMQVYVRLLNSNVNHS